MSPRDSQRQRVYDAERIAFDDAHGPIAITLGKTISVDECQKLVDVVCLSPYLREKYGVTRATPVVVAGHGNRDRGCYKYRRNEIHLPEWTRQRWYVLHEVAHYFVPRTADRAAHGQEWAACYVDLVRAYLGHGAENALIAAFRAKRVTWKPKRAYTISDAERARRAERARSLRA